MNGIEFIFSFIGLVIVWYLFGLIGLAILALLIAFMYGISNRSKQKQEERDSKNDFVDRMILEKDYEDHMIRNGFVFNIESGKWEKEKG